MTALLGVAITEDEDVLGLDVPMGVAALVQLAEAPQDLHEHAQLHRLGDAYNMLRNHAVEQGSVRGLHDNYSEHLAALARNVRDASHNGLKGEHLHNVSTAQGLQHRHLLHGLLEVLGRLPPDGLDGHLATRLGVGRDVYAGIVAGADEAQVLEPGRDWVAVGGQDLDLDRLVRLRLREDLARESLALAHEVCHEFACVVAGAEVQLQRGGVQRGVLPPRRQRGPGVLPRVGLRAAEPRRAGQCHGGAGERRGLPPGGPRRRDQAPHAYRGPRPGSARARRRRILRVDAGRCRRAPRAGGGWEAPPGASHEGQAKSELPEAADANAWGYARHGVARPSGDSMGKP
mmetsp:Transcript_69391/g.194562  ORF Transcript_69391/g.194562 Transcript_69391/m.194562 type:complete len:345 (+) Transcript_69391:512-1546(+)